WGRYEPLLRRYGRAVTAPSGGSEPGGGDSDEPGEPERVVAEAGVADRDAALGESSNEDIAVAVRGDDVAAVRAARVGVEPGEPPDGNLVVSREQPDLDVRVDGLLVAGAGAGVRGVHVHHTSTR